MSDQDIARLIRPYIDGPAPIRLDEITATQSERREVVAGRGPRRRRALVVAAAAAVVVLVVGGVSFVVARSNDRDPVVKATDGTAGGSSAQAQCTSALERFNRSQVANGDGESASGVSLALDATVGDVRAWLATRPPLGAGQTGPDRLLDGLGDAQLVAVCVYDGKFALPGAPNGAVTATAARVIVLSGGALVMDTTGEAAAVRSETPTAFPVAQPPGPPVSAGPVDPSTLPKKVPVGDHRGTIRGYIYRAPDSGAFVGGVPGQTLPTGDRGIPVTNNNGLVTGYWLDGYGFVDPISAKDPAVVRSLLTNSLQLVDQDGKVVGIEEWTKRVKDGTADTR